MGYAEKTNVSPGRSREEIERCVTKYGGKAFMYGWQDELAMVCFELNSRRLRFTLALPKKEEYKRTEKRRSVRSSEQADRAWEQACMSSWRALALIVKAKLEAVTSGITTFDEEFLSHIVLPNGNTVGQEIIPKVDTAYSTGQMPALLEFQGGGR